MAWHSGSTYSARPAHATTPQTGTKRSTRRRGSHVLLAVVAAAALLLASCSSGGAEVTTIGADELVSTTNDTTAVVVDVRTPPEFAAGHIEGAVNIDVESPSFDAQVAELDPEAAFVVYCQSGNRSRVAADRMVDAGFTEVYNVDAGIATISAAGIPLVSE